VVYEQHFNTCNILNADSVPEKLKAEAALEEWERGMTDAG
jgi:hypothetical protein